MPKSENTKKATKPAAKKTTTAKKAPAKKAPVKKAPAKKPAEKKAPAKKVEVKNIEPAKEVVKVKEEKKGNNTLVEKVKSNVPFAVALCIIVILLAALIFTICIKRIPRVKDQQVIATIKGKKITADDLYQQLKVDGGTNALISIVDDYIADKEVKITKDDKAYVDEVVNYYKEYAEYYGVDLPTFLASYVGLPGVTNEDEFYDYVLNDYKKTLAVIKFIGDSASEKDLKEYYKENYTDKLTVKHILIEVDEEAEDGDAKAKAKAQSIIDTLKKTDSKDLESKFNKLAEDNSDDTATYSNGGLLEGISKNDVVEEFWNAAIDLKDGKFTTEPVKTSYGYHVILRISSTKADKYEDIKDEVKKAYAQNLISQDSTLTVKKWDELRKQYKLSIKDDEILKIYNETVKTASTPVENVEEQK